MVEPEIIKEVNEALKAGVPLVQIKQALIDKGLAAPEINAIFNSLTHEEGENPTPHQEQTLQEQKAQIVNASMTQTESSLATSQISSPVKHAETHTFQLITTSIAISIVATIVSCLVYIGVSFMNLPSAFLYILIVLQAVAVGFIAVAMIKKLTTNTYADAAACLICAFLPMTVTYCVIFLLNEIKTRLPDLGMGLGGLFSVVVQDISAVVIVYMIFLIIPFIIHILTQPDKKGIVVFLGAPIVYYVSVFVGEAIALAVLSGLAGFI